MDENKSKKLLTPESRELRGREELEKLAQLQLLLNPNHHSASGIVDGKFAGIEGLNINEDGNIVLTRQANSEKHLTKGWVNASSEELLNTSLSQGGGNGLPTSGFKDWDKSFNTSSEFTSTFIIPPKDLQNGIVQSNALIGNLGEGEIVLNPKWAKQYLSKVNGEEVTSTSTGVNYSKSGLSIENTNKSPKVGDGLPDLIDLSGIPSSDKGVEIPSNMGGNPTEEVENLVNNQFNTTASTTPPPNNPKPPPKKQTKPNYNNQFKSFFDGEGISLHSFDTETTGLDHKNVDLGKRARIWQVAMATFGEKGGDLHVNPIYETLSDGSLKEVNNLQIPVVSDILKRTNSFTEKAFNRGSFDEFLMQYNEKSLESLGDSLKKTLSTVGARDVIVLQNMNFENNVLRSSVEQGILSEDIYNEVASRLNTSSVDRNGRVLGLFQPPKVVQEHTRRANFLFHTQFLKTESEEVWSEYMSEVNQSFDKYKEAINNPNRKGTIAVELQDITKAFYANAADKGFIEKGAANLGLNVSFLSEAILKEPELHTAYSDADQTNRLFLEIASMTDELRSGSTVSERTKEILETIKEKQPSEVNVKFLSSIKSVISDFSISSETNYSGINNWYNPEVLLREKDSVGLIDTHTLEKITTGKAQEKTRVLSEALNNILEKYDHYSENLYGFNRAKYVENLLKDYRHTDFKGMSVQVDIDHENYKPDFTLRATTQNLVRNVEIPKQGTPRPSTNDPIKFLGMEMKPTTKRNLLIGGGLALGAMALTTKPDPQPDNSGNVSENFYDEQYLGTAFVDFKERNKHYMM